MDNNTNAQRAAIKTQRRLLVAFISGITCLMALSPACGYAQTDDALQIGLVDFNAWRKSGDHPIGMQLEYRSGQHYRYGLQPMGGILVTRERNAYVYGGVFRDFALGQYWRISANFSAGLYRDGDGKNLGGPIEFQSGLGIYRQMTSGNRLGLAVRHISNAHIYDHNPGTENIILFYSHPLR